MADAVSLGSTTKTQANESGAPEFSLDYGHQQRKLRKYDLLYQAGELLPNERVSSCMQSRISADSPVELLFDEETGRGGYSNVQRCGSVWHCPICASKISEERKAELHQAVTLWESTGGGVGMLTLTLQHVKSERLADILPSLQSSLTRFWGHRRVKEFQQKLGIVGKIRAFEVTYGQNGWHPHVHVLLFFDDAWLRPDQIEDLRSFLAAEWSSALEKSYKFASTQHGVDFRWADSAVADYVAKFGGDSIDLEKTPEDWGPAAEMSKSAFKIGKNRSVAPFELLSMSAHGDEQAGRLFVEYAQAFKGKRQLVWSRGLKDLIGLEDLPDSDLVADDDGRQTHVIAQFNFVAWRAIIRAGLLGILLDEVEQAADLWSAKLAIDLLLYQNNITIGVYVPGLHKTAYEV